MKRSQILLFNSILLSIYLVGSIPFYLTEGSSLERFPIASAIYVYIIVFHEIFVLLATFFQWIGYFSKSRGWIRFANWTLLAGGFLGILLIIPIFVTIPIIFINMISKSSKKKKETDS
ncbi:MAG: hypothetical protein K9L02_01745 [Acholeplasmataceae bacterium]|nr:hypothetical protein [Acholeplasmataceae bacterium]